VPVASDCGSLTIACFDELPQASLNLVCLRPTTRWSKTALSWRVINFLPDVDVSFQTKTIRQALDMWSSVSTLTFQQVTERADITLFFVRAEHGDPFPFEGPGQRLGHACFSGTQRAGEVHLCREEAWGDGVRAGQLDLLTVVAHELGHALGLEHTERAEALMFASYTGPTQTLSAEDVSQIHRLYGSQDGLIKPEPVLDVSECGIRLEGLLAIGAPDSDGDGIPDAIEVFVVDTDPFEPDTDGDGVQDGVEVVVDRTSPTTSGPDRDADNLPDAAELVIGTVRTVRTPTATVSVMVWKFCFLEPIRSTRTAMATACRTQRIRFPRTRSSRCRFVAWANLTATATAVSMGATSPMGSPRIAMETVSRTNAIWVVRPAWIATLTVYPTNVRWIATPME